MENLFKMENITTLVSTKNMNQIQIDYCINNNLLSMYPGAIVAAIIPGENMKMFNNLGKDEKTDKNIIKNK